MTAPHSNSDLLSNQERRPMVGLLSTLRRMAVISEESHPSTHQFYDALQSMLVHTKNDLERKNQLERLCHHHAITLFPDVYANEDLNGLFNKVLCSTYYSLWNKSLTKEALFHMLPIKLQFAMLYAEVCQKILKPYFSVEDAAWHPSQGVMGLKDSLRLNGPHIFIGKFGKLYHSLCEEYPRGNQGQRKAYSFPKGSYIGDTVEGTNCVTVDQVQTVNGIDLVFFHDPLDESTPDQTEAVYVLSYQNFIERLTNLFGRRYTYHECDYTMSFGFISTKPKKISTDTTP